MKDNNRNSEISTKCEFCENDDTTEHLFECAIPQRLMKAINLKSVDNMQELRRIASYIEQVNEK